MAGRSWRGIRPTMIACAFAALGVAPAVQGAEGVLRSIGLQAEGRLLRIDLECDEPPTRHSISRQGPPEKRDIVVRLPGFVSETPARMETGDYLMPIEVKTEPSNGAEPVLIVVLGFVGDSLVRVSQDEETLSVVVIPPPKRSDDARAYRIGSNDMLQIDVFGHEDLNKTLKVSPNGLIHFPMIGNVRAAGHTVDEIAEEITRRLGEKYIRDPHVTVSVWEYLSQWVNVIGEVTQPGRYYMTGPTTLIDALSQAGGLTETAGEEILVTRQPDLVDPSSAGEVLRVDVARLFSSQGADLNVELRPGDIVNVLEADPGRANRP